MRHLFSPKPGQDSPYFQRIQAAIALEGSGESTVVDRALGSRRLRITISGPAATPGPTLAAPTPSSRSRKRRRHRQTPPPRQPAHHTQRRHHPRRHLRQLHPRSRHRRSRPTLHLRLELDRLELSVLQIIEAELTAKPDLRLQAERIGNRPSGFLHPNSTLYTSLRAIDRHLSLQTDARIGSTDANLPLSLDIPALAIGCGGTSAGIHTIHEWFDPTGRETALRRILLLLLDTCTRSPKEG